MTPRISFCIITKNEEANMPRCLASIEDVADEIIVTDTGSTDETVAIAQRAGASVDHFEWIDDFSAAYTHCIRRATGDWIFLIDADEELLEESHAELKQAACREEVFACTVLRQDLTDANRPHIYAEMLQTRLWRWHEAIGFVGRIHHQFTPPLMELAKEQGRRVIASSIRMRHWGYLDQDKHLKLERAERLMTLELEDRPSQFYYHVELGRTRIALGDDSGVELLRRAAEQVKAEDPQVAKYPGQLAMLLENLLACDVLPESFPLSLREAEQLATERFPHSAPIIWQRALARFKSGRFDQCANLLEKLLELGRSGAYDKWASFDPEIMGRDALLNLGVCFARQGRSKDAILCFDQLTGDPKHGEAARKNAESLRLLR